MGHHAEHDDGVPERSSNGLNHLFPQPGHRRPEQSKWQQTPPPPQGILPGYQGPEAYKPCPSYLEVGIWGHRQTSWCGGGVCLRTDGTASFSPCCRPQRRSTGHPDSTVTGSGLLCCPMVLLPGSSPGKCTFYLRPAVSMAT